MSDVKVNLGAVPDVAAANGLSETQEARFPAAAIGLEQTGMNDLLLRPGVREAFAHRHERAEEVVLVLGGSGRIRLDDEVLPLEPRDLVHVRPGVTRRLEAGPDGLEVLVVGPHVEGDGEIVPGFWDP